MLTQRQRNILIDIVHHYTKNGQPIGSKAITKALPQKVSSATVRNDMESLERKGLLQKTHLSSGRIPSIKGYRYYVHNLLLPAPVSNTDKQIISGALSNHFQRVDDIVKQSADILSNLTHYTVMALRPETAKHRKLSGFRLVPLMNHEAMAILVTDNGEIKNQTFHLDNDVTAEQLESVIKLINHQLVGNSISTVFDELSSQFPKEIMQFVNTPEGFLNTFNDVLNKIAKDQMYVTGKLNLLNFMNSSDPSNIKAMYSFLDDTKSTSKFIGYPSKPLSVHVGSKSQNSLLNHYSVITGTYDVGSHGKGLIAVLGPTRMPYSKIIGIVNVFRKELAKRLIAYYNKYDK